MSKNKLHINCDLCGSSERMLIAIENEYPISKCLNCEFVYVNVIPKIENGKFIGEYYEGAEEEIATANALANCKQAEVDLHAARDRVKYLEIAISGHVTRLEAQATELSGTDYVVHNQ